MANSIVKCPDCGSKSISHYFHTEMEIVSCQNMRREPDSIDEIGRFAGINFVCPSLGRWSNLFDRQGNFLRRVAWEQRNIKNNEPNELIIVNTENQNIERSG